MSSKKAVFFGREMLREKMENREFFIDKDGFKIHAKLDFPQGEAEKMPLVILVHGLTGHMEEPHLLGIRSAINEIGMACLRVELYGHGQSDGAFKNHNVMEWVSQLIYVIDYARSLSFVSDLYLSGHSQGGLATILAAALKADQLKAIIPLSPATCIVDFCKKGVFFETEFDACSIPEELHFWEDKVVTANYIRVGRSLPLKEAIAGYKGPVLLVHGVTDESVPVQCSIDAKEAYENAELVLIENETHCYDNHLNQVLEAVKKFLTATNGL